MFSFIEKEMVTNKDWSFSVYIEFKLIIQILKSMSVKLLLDQNDTWFTFCNTCGYQGSFVYSISWRLLHVFVNELKKTFVIQL